MEQTLGVIAVQFYDGFYRELKRRRYRTTLSRRLRVRGLKQLSIECGEDTIAGVTDMGKSLARRVMAEHITKFYLAQIPNHVTVHRLASVKDGISIRAINQYQLSPIPQTIYRFDGVGV